MLLLRHASFVANTTNGDIGRVAVTLGTRKRLYRLIAQLALESTESRSEYRLEFPHESTSASIETIRLRLEKELHYSRQRQRKQYIPKHIWCSDAKPPALCSPARYRSSTQTLIWPHWVTVRTWHLSCEKHMIVAERMSPAASFCESVALRPSWEHYTVITSDGDFE